jgi:hypothetical protein
MSEALSHLNVVPYDHPGSDDGRCVFWACLVSYKSIAGGSMAGLATSSAEVDALIGEALTAVEMWLSPILTDGRRPWRVPSCERSEQDEALLEFVHMFRVPLGNVIDDACVNEIRELLELRRRPTAGNTKSWGGEWTLLAIAFVRKVNIVVLDSRSPTRYIQGSEFTASAPLGILRSKRGRTEPVRSHPGLQPLCEEELHLVDPFIAVRFQTMHGDVRLFSHYVSLVRPEHVRRPS